MDKPYGRNKKQIKVPEPKIFGKKHSIPVYQEKDLSQPFLVKRIKEIQPDLMIVISYGKMIPENIFKIPFLGTINLHASLLPKYRGASPIQNALLKGDKVTGVSIQKINQKLDQGNILLIESQPIEENDNYRTLKIKLSKLTASILTRFITIVEKGDFPDEKPQKNGSSYCKKIKKEDGKIKWDKDNAKVIINKWRAFIEWPEIFCFHMDKMIKFKEIEFVNRNDGKPGEILKADKEGLIIKAKEKAIKVKILQSANKKPMHYIDFLNGTPLKTGEILE